MIVEGMRNILMTNFDFLDQTITILCDANNYMHPTKKEIKKQLMMLVEEANADDILFVYITGHCHEFETDKVGILTSDQKFITDEFLSNKMMPKMNPEATLTVMINMCYAGSFMKAAKEVGNVIVFALSGENETMMDGEIYFEVLERILEDAKEETTNLKLYRQCTMQHN